jgi:hypothetical protein
VLFVRVQNGHWVNLLADPDDENTKNAIRSLTETERKRREAVWELFNSECVFLIDHLMVLKHVSNVTFNTPRLGLLPNGKKSLHGDWT